MLAPVVLSTAMPTTGHVDIVVRTVIVTALVTALFLRLSAAITGFFQLERLLPAAVDLDLETKADALATTVRRGFEPPVEPTAEALEAAAPVVIELHEQLLIDLTRNLPEGGTP